MAKYSPKYWNGKGRFQKRYDVLWAALVPASGESAVLYGEVLRWAGKMYYDIFNNGGWNMRDMDFRQRMILDKAQEFHPFADKLHVDEFGEKLERFTEVEGTHREYDEVLDVIVSYVWSEHQKALKQYGPMTKLVDNALWVASFLDTHQPYFSDGKSMETDLGTALADLAESAEKVRILLKKQGIEVPAEKDAA